MREPMPGRGETVRVAAIFEPGRRIRPVWFERRRRQHRVTATTYSWHDRVGDLPLVHFTVTDGEALYELVYSPLEGVWTLVEQQAAP